MAFSIHEKKDTDTSISNNIKTKWLIWEIQKLPATCDFKITSERTIVLNANHYCIPNVNFFFSIKFTYFRIGVFFRE
jgi:hypothetical protein